MPCIILSLLAKINNVLFSILSYDMVMLTLLVYFLFGVCFHIIKLLFSMYLYSILVMKCLQLLNIKKKMISKAKSLLYKVRHSLDLTINILQDIK